MKYLSLLIVTLFLAACTVVQAPTSPTSSPEESPVEKSRAVVSQDFSNQGLASIPEQVWNMTSLEVLDVSGNHLTGALPAEIRQLQGLVRLDASNNKMTGVPAEIGQLVQLEYLNLSNNQLTGLPHELGNLKNLKTLDLRGNNPSQFDLDIIRQNIPQADILL